MKSLPQDKANHAIYGAVIACVLLMLGVSPTASLLCVAVVGAGKEIADWAINRMAGLRVHGVEFLDFVATVAGGLLVVLPEFV